MDDLKLVEVIETEVRQLSDEGQETWATIESAAELNEPGSPEFMATLPDLEQKRNGLSREDRHAIQRLIKLHKECKDANELEKACSDPWFASEWRQRAIVRTAQRKDQQEGRSIDRDMTTVDAIRKLIGSP